MTLNADNKRIAKNTMMLYIRMIVSLIVSLYTSRVILAALGVTDYGLNNVVSGIISMFTFVNSSLSVATTRFLTYELGVGNTSSFRNIFSMSINLHIVLSLMILILGETIGLWILLNELVIPENRVVACIWIYQVSILSCILNTINVPYISALIAHERMGAFGYMTILDNVLKLLIVYVLVIIPADRLIVYSWLFFAMNLISLLIYQIYCRKKIPGTNYSFSWNVKLFQSMFSFTGWSSLVHIANFASSQGLNMLLNVFFGPVVNAARGVTNQVNIAIYKLSSSFQTALNPQITKNYAQNNQDRVFQLFSASSRLAYYVIFIISLPIALEAPYILRLWLRDVPEYTVQFLRVILCMNLIEALANPIYAVVEATGKIKRFQIVNGLVILLIFPISYLFLKFLDISPVSIFIIQLFFSFVGQICRQMMFQKIINIGFTPYYINILKPILAITILSLFFSISFSILIGQPYNLYLLILYTLVYILIVVTLIWLLGLKPEEKKIVSEKILKYIKSNIYGC